MTTWVIFLRGVMPTGRNKVPMAPLREALGSAGLKQVRTYIQSGNVIAVSRLGQARIEARVHDVIAATFGGDIAVVARTAEQVRGILDRNPFRGADPARMYFTLLAARPDPALVSTFLESAIAPDKVELHDDTVYSLVAARYSDSKVGNNYIERKLRVAATTRVFNTVSALAVLSGSEP